MNREVPYDEAAICDECGHKGAFDFMGDYYCAMCVPPLGTEEAEGEDE